MANDRAPLGPDEAEYRTEIATDEVEPDGPAVTSAPPWLALGLVLLVVFVGILAYAVVLPALG